MKEFASSVYRSTPPGEFRTTANSRFSEDWAQVDKSHSATLPTGIYIVIEFYASFIVLYIFSKQSIW